jgi:putative transposase
MVGKHIVTVAARREGGQFLGGRGLSRRRACVLRQLPRSTFSSWARSDGNAELAAQVDERARRHPRSGDRRGWALRRRRDRRGKKKHGHRRWKRATRQVRQVTRTRGPARAARVPGQALHPGHVWTADCRPDHGLQGRPMTVLTVMEACTREGRALEVARSWPAPRVLTVLEGLVVRQGRPPFSRRDNGPECSALALRGWLAPHPRQTWYIDPGCPWQNGFGASFKGPVRDECLTMPGLHAVAEARMVLAAYRRQSHAERPHSSLGYRTPTEFKRDWIEPQSPAGGLYYFHWTRLLGACQG